MEFAANSSHGLSQGVPSAHFGRVSKESLQFHFKHHSFLFMPRRALQRLRGKPSISAGIVSKESGSEYLELMKRGIWDGHQDMQNLLQLAQLDVKTLTAAASEVRDRGPWSGIISFSPKVFIPLTRACRDACAYCTFALAPRPDHKIYMSIDEVLDIARKGAAVGCTEALFTLGDKPELLYPRAKEEVAEDGSALEDADRGDAENPNACLDADETQLCITTVGSVRQICKRLASLGHDTTVSYVAEVAKIVLEQTGLLPHLNAGVISKSELALLRKASASQGLMLETVSERLLKPGKAHYRCFDKVPLVRLATIAAAGEENVPFTSGLLIGIGESREERILTLLELWKVHEEHGHIQELIIQNFCAKKGTLMERAAEPSLEELQWTIAMARLIFGPSMNIQAPPNLTPSESSNGDEWVALIEAGINDWGGISPLTKDWVNPEAPWPQLSHLAAATAKAGKILVPRLAIYPQFIQNFSKWLVMQNPRFLAFLQPPLPSQQVGSLDHIPKPDRVPTYVIHATNSMETPVHLLETMPSPKPMSNAQEQVAETPIFQAMPVQSATFQQPNVGSNGQGRNLQAMQQVFPPPSVVLWRWISVSKHGWSCAWKSVLHARTVFGVLKQ
ncbi:hypothetical protein L7F22_000203 [Adiantum nelumboides]|nr:hypothetical protein [Adiantum nelumboides]